MVIVSGKEALLHTFTDTYMLLHFFFFLSFQGVDTK